MFQSFVNIFDNSSNLWNIEQLRKVLKVPQDQLKELENIPGWTSGKKDTIKDKTDILTFHETKENATKSPLISEKVKSKINSVTSNSTNLIHLKAPRILLQDYNVPLHVDEALSFSNNTKQHSLVRSFSLSSLSKLTRAVSNSVLKRSSSTSSINTDSLLNFNSDSDNSEKMSSIIHTVLKKPFNKISPLSSPRSFSLTATTKDTYVEKSQFINSAVQCQMSQCSQPEFENSENVVIANQTVDSQSKNSVPDTHSISPNNSNFALENKFETKIIFPRPTLDNYDGSENYSSSKITETNKSNEDIHMPDVEISLISQPIPCAQPLLSDTTPQPTDIAVSSSENVTASFKTVDIPKMSGKVIKDISKEKDLFSVKRKRKNKQGKLPKKVRTMKASEIEILYSPNQIQGMIKIIKHMTLTKT